MRHRLQAVTLIAYGALVIRLATGSDLLRYVRPSSRPAVLLAASALVAGAVGGIAEPVLRRRRAREPPSGSRAGWLLAAPVFALAVVAPPALGVSAAAGTPAVPRHPGRPFAELRAGDPVGLRLSDLVLRTVWDHGRTLRGRVLAVDGFVLRRSADGFVLARLVITCCAADAQPYDVAVRTTLAAPGIGRWVRVTGRYAGVSATDRDVPVLSAGAVAPIRAPTDPYD